MTRLAITLAQLNPTVGDIAGNIEKVREVFHNHKDMTDIIVFSEMVVSGYPTDDLVLKPFFIDRIMADVTKFVTETADSDVGIVLSTPWRYEGGVYNTALFIHKGKIEAMRFKHNLPNYGVFDEVRVFSAGPLPVPVEFKGVKLGILTCEDMWFPEATAHLKENGAEILLSPNGSPYEAKKTSRRLEVAQQRVAESGLALVYVNQVGGQDDLVFDGASFVMSHEGKALTLFPGPVEHIETTVWEKQDDKMVCIEHAPLRKKYTELESIYYALVLGLKDYVDKNNFPGVVLGMSGGVDSAISAAIAVDALGPERVRCIMMPSEYTSNESLEDAKECSEMLGAKYEIVAIKPAREAFDSMLKEANTPNTGITAENIQARSRGLLLMAISNSTNYMVLSTGNKSEMSVGYATLYGDMCGGFNAIKDVYKTTIFELCNWRNEHWKEHLLGPKGRVIPERIITKPPTAELRPDQKDEDSLPPYEQLDDILHCIIESEMGLDAIAERGHDIEMVNKIWKLVDRAEYKRRQSCPGVKATSKAFGRDRRYPITNKFTNIVTDEG